MNVSLIGEPRSAEIVHSGGELVAPGPAHSWARHPELIRAGMEKASLQVTVLSFRSQFVGTKRQAGRRHHSKRTAKMPFKSI